MFPQLLSCVWPRSTIVTHPEGSTHKTTEPELGRRSHPQAMARRIARVDVASQTFRPPRQRLTTHEGLLPACAAALNLQQHGGCTNFFALGVEGTWWAMTPSRVWKKLARNSACACNMSNCRVRLLSCCDSRHPRRAALAQGWPQRMRLLRCFAVAAAALPAEVTLAPAIVPAGAAQVAPETAPTIPLSFRLAKTTPKMAPI